MGYSHLTTLFYVVWSIQKFSLALTNLKSLWRRFGILLLIKGSSGPNIRLRNVAIWEGICAKIVLKYRFLDSISKAELEIFFSQPEVRPKIMGPTNHSLGEVLKLGRLKLLDHILHFLTEDMSCCMLFSEAGSDWKESKWPPGEKNWKPFRFS